ncbi:hypothetical protein A2W54_01270 [Candidatus Giovannonibacteria bacterium RIFCSPHIGHO2_02_43_13]|uniref:Uncharacterized protein n=1 Tax=Candidatus Giovannonibacteria bacterium RIFCSPHIGHO2_02_43_13 TaxID=1798330 RepID=A0A1F5WUL8_9BACT|nr:MAG: hypothetical protein A3E06_03245 [Candidatus Giovannonibacteria bacterium RIFCSPHIGHO2_12_FULL_44_42]OGF79345.1 MAG: hypothetical protein A2W54_01270 [Candidatus Giovannonibacteria bacterium RIFCSPHIGHO2_02_43_13]OGF90268.1 MAG: hypothetical protein A3I94_01580 [Candidatus Giovannonibacteria bacterium RIFCSPLOWO2_02_FULL_43_54]OGF97250.1 MAG: hypothetical protein A3H08_02750 [Candidatus Giovannonibacteria bacterium RIFCSPLOWO2_12_FULL_44_32]
MEESRVAMRITYCPAGIPNVGIVQALLLVPLPIAQEAQINATWFVFALFQSVMPTVVLTFAKPVELQLIC